MRYWRLSLRGGHVWAIVALIGLLACTAQGAGKKRGRPIEFSAPNSDEVTTNLHQLTSRKDSLKELEEDLYKSMQTFAPKSSLDGVAAPPSRLPAGPVIPNKRVKELLERRKNWVFANPTDLMSEPTANELLKIPEYGPDGQEKKTPSLMEQYYEQLAAKRRGRTGTSQHKDDDLSGTPNPANPREDLAEHDDSALPVGLRQSEQELRRVVESNSGDGGTGPTAARNSFSDIFGLGDPSSLREKTLEHKKYMDEFQRILDFQPTPVSGADSAQALGGSWDAARGSANLGSGLEGYWGSSRRDGFDTQLGAINPTLTPSGPLDVNAQVLGQSSSTPTVSKTDVPKAAVPAPTFTAPKRAF
jgi:hypothetical protein